MKVFVILLVLVGFVGLVFAESDEPKVPEPTPTCPEGTILKDDTCIEVDPICGEGTTYHDGICVVMENNENDENNVSGKWGQGLQNRVIDPPLKQIQSGVKFHNVECKKGLELVYKKTDDTSACVTLFSKIELVVRGWAKDTRVLLGCTGDRIQKCYPEDPFEYRKALYDYYFGDEKGLPSSDDYEFESLHTTNACTDKPWICFGELDNGTKIRITCDYPIHGCGVMSFDKANYKIYEGNKN